MSSLMFWHSLKKYNKFTINTYYLAEDDVWLFLATDIYNVIDKINKSGCTIVSLETSVMKPVARIQLRVFQNNRWEMIDVLKREDILEVTNSHVSVGVKNFVRWIDNLCSSVPEDCFLQKDSKEYEFVDLAINRFMNLYEEINNCSFMNLSPETRLHKIKDFFSVYTELLSYPPIKEHIDFIGKTRPPMESVISSDFVKFIRNVLAHFPFFATWDEIYISKKLVNWESEGKSIDKFLKKYQGHKDVQYRFKERATNKWRYPIIKFPKEYNDGKVFLKDMVNEKDGILLCAVLMFKVVSSQIIYQSEPK